MGGGSLMTPALVFIFGFNPATAIGTDVLHGAIFKTVGGCGTTGSARRRRSSRGWMLVGSAPASLLGVVTSTWLQHRYGDGARHDRGQRARRGAPARRDGDAR